jgi:hypothetical protein
VTNAGKCVLSSVVCLAVLVTASATVAALPALVTIPGAIEVGSAGLPAACLAVCYGMGVALQPWLLPARSAPRRAPDGPSVPRPVKEVVVLSLLCPRRSV